jgi:LCP family protein required for cell wall assembly
MKRPNQIGKIVYYSLILILVLVVIFSGLQILESTIFKPVVEDTAPPSKTITRDGVDYFPRQDITVMLVMGIDEFGPVQSSGSTSNPGAADMVTLLIFDEKNEQTRILCLNRDTMLDVSVLGINGQKAGTTFAQLAIAHTYGSGMEDSCENTRDTVSDFLYGITIDHYVSANMDAINLMNDAVDGVTVYVEDDFSAVDPTITMGEVTLRGQQAINFVRTRKNLGDQLNISRMERHKAYASGFMEAFREKMDDGEEFMLTLYESIDPYIVTDCSVTVLTSMMERYANYEIVEIVSPEGRNVMGEKYYEFHVDEQKLDQLILRLFYEVK